MASDTKRGSLSRLSPLARPFTLSKPINPSFARNSSLQDTSLSPSSSILDQSFSSFSLEGDSFAYYPQYSSGVCQESADFALFTKSKSDFNAVPVNKSPELGYKPKSGDHQGILHWKDKLGGFSISNDDPTKQGSPAEGLKLSAETSDSLCGKFSGISRKDLELRPKTSRQIDTKCISFSAVKSGPTPSNFSTSSDLHSSALLQDPQSGINYLPPAISWSSCDSNIASFGRSFSQQLDFHPAKLNVSPSSDSDYLPALASEPSGASTSYSPLNHGLSENLDSDGYGGVSKNNIFWYGQASGKKPHAVVDRSKKVFHGEVLTDKGKERKMVKPVTHEIMEPVPMAKSELQITCPRLPTDLTLKSLGVEESDPIENSSKIINVGDSDLDSPCWKGKLAANQSSCEVSIPDNFQHLKSGQEACSNLNPLAPHFFPSKDKQKVNYCGNECDEDDGLSFQKTASSAVSLSSREQRLQNSATAGSSSSEQSSITETHCYNDMHVPNKHYELRTDSCSSSMLSSSCMVQPSVLKDYFTSSGQLLSGQNVRGFGKDVKDAVPNSTSVPLFASKHVISSSSCRAGVSANLSETYGGVTKPLCTPPRLDIQIVVKTMNELSELLMQKCANDFDSLNEHEHDIIKRIVHNLTLCTRSRVGEHTLTSESGHPCTSYCVMKSADLSKVWCFGF
ncbi:unnamed protein product [Dovyalis caffra]|uniref:Uncharacterized protein n=1 Tax=Dovyalis caffra TaxID=77055 RepID=A0AAV1SWN6_9ROSI|nr:unnamed protein product [Dovyalis caffra]